MTAPFRMDEQCSIERRTVARDPDYGTETNIWEVVAANVWCNAQDQLPSRGESTSNGLATSVTRTRLRIHIDCRITTEMRVTLHGKRDRQMQIIAGPALLDDRRHAEFMLEGYSHG
jgi:Phage head-tail joining protein